MCSKWPVRESTRSSHASPALRGGGRIARRDAHRDRVVAIAVEHELWNAERESLPRRRELVALEVLRRIAEQRPRRLDGRHQAARQGEIEDARLRNGSADPDARVSSRRLGGQGLARRRPERELPSGRVPDRGNAREIERRLDVGERVDSGGHVQERLRPPASAADAAVLEVPRGEAVRGQVEAEPLHERAVVLRAPVPAVHDDGNRMRPGARRQEELADLAGTAAVCVNETVHRTSRLRRDPNEALDHRGHLLVRVQLVEVPRADRHPDVDVRSQRKQASRVVAATGLRKQHEQGDVAALERCDAVPLQKPTQDRRRDARRHRAHRLDDPVAAVEIVRGQQQAGDVVAPGIVVGQLELLGQRLQGAPRLRERVDRPGVDGDDRRRKRRMTDGELEPDQPSEAVADDDRPRDLERVAEPCEIVREGRDLVAVNGSIAPSAAPQVVRQDARGRPEVFVLRLEERVVAAPSVNEDECRIAGAGSLVVQAQVVSRRVRHHTSGADTSDAPGRIRTCDLALRRRALYPLSYGRRETASVTTGGIGSGRADRGRLGDYTDLVTTVFSSTIAAKAWLATAAVVLAGVQLLTAARIYGKLSFLPERGRGIARVHRWSGRIAFLFTLPVFFHCVTILGFQTPDTRVAIHSLVGTFFYGVFAAKVLIVRDHSLSRWTLPTAGLTLASMLVALWVTSSLWYFTTIRFGF